MVRYATGIHQIFYKKETNNHCERVSCAFLLPLSCMFCCHHSHKLRMYNVYQNRCF